MGEEEMNRGRERVRRRRREQMGKEERDKGRERAAATTSDRVYLEPVTRVLSALPGIEIPQRTPQLLSGQPATTW